jgi:hypothetical protein
MFEQHHAALLLHVEIYTAQEFFDYFKEATKDPAPAHAVPLFNLEHDSYAVMAAKEQFKDLIEALFIHNWLSAYLTVQHKQAQTLQLKQFLVVALKTASTPPVAMDIDSHH